MNKVHLIGRLTRDPELNFSSNGKAVSNFTIAVNGYKKEDVDFINCVAWGKIAENLNKYMSKGKLINITGSIKTRNYEAKDGTKRYVTEVLCNEINFLEKGNDNNNNSNNSNSGNNNYYHNNMQDITPMDDTDIPF